MEIESDDDETVMYYGRRCRRVKDRYDPEYIRQRQQFYFEFNRGEGFEIDWDQFDYPFAEFNVAGSTRLEVSTDNDELLHELTLHRFMLGKTYKATRFIFTWKKPVILKQGSMIMKREST
ncbi:PREDICTED: uncharacterized protein LOC104809075 [Tarenaya hassleriana]|uniref:uncharacterized protein LOC104809075 n=1 Tax=Tarenaya hassleriana TaxID=28532 RepID=UPI00053C90A4|nr:PREDICTED: uncharacterized protein LOC104809075 [Tarenaya hassleriana]